MIVNRLNSEKTALWNENYISVLKPLNQIDLPLDLTKNYDPTINWRIDPVKYIKKIEHLLKWILVNKDQLKTNESKLNFDFVSYRRSLLKIMISPYVDEEWIIGASKHNGTIYLCNFRMPEKNFSGSNLISFGGHNFENMITSSKYNFVHDSQYSYQYLGVLSSKLNGLNGSISILLAGELDCLDYDKDDSSCLDNFIEIKSTTKKYENWNQFCKYKSAQWWAQSYLSGITKIVCGYKNSNLNVTKIKYLNVDNLPNQNYWNHQICLNFLHKFLNHIQTIMANETDPSIVYLFRNSNFEIINCWKCSSTEKIRFLPQWYIDEI